MADSDAVRSKRYRAKHPERNKKACHNNYIKNRAARLEYQRKYDRNRKEM